MDQIVYVEPVLQQRLAQQVLTQFEEHPESWTKVPDVLERCSFQQSKVSTSRFIVYWFIPIAHYSHSTLDFRSWRNWSKHDGRLYQRVNGRVTQLCHILSQVMLKFRLGVRNFIIGVIIKVSSDETSLRKERSYVNKLNLALIQVCPSLILKGSV